jgi:hypothetical protein
MGAAAGAGPQNGDRRRAPIERRYGRKDNSWQN